MKVVGMMFICGFFCQAQIIAVPTRAQKQTAQTTKTTKKKHSSNFPMPSGAKNTPSVTQHQISPTGHAAMDKFRNSIMGDLNDFRNTIIDHYADFLDGEWHEYEPLKGSKKYSVPKPETLIDTEGKEVPKIDKALLDEGARQTWKDSLRQRPILPEDMGMNSKKTDVWGSMDSKSLDKVLTSKPVKNVVKDIEHGAAAMTRDMPGDWINFYELDVRVPDIDFTIPESLDSSNLSYSTAKMWRQLQQDDIASKVLPELNSIAERMNLNDYFKYSLVAKYIDAKFPDASRLSKAVAMHYLLVNMGYGVRLGYAPANDNPLMVIPTDQQLYEKPVLSFNDNTYYLFDPFDEIDFMDGEGIGQWNILTCSLPVEAEYGVKFNFDLAGLNLPEIPLEYSIEYDGLKLEGTVNEAMFPFLADYPQMATDHYAISFINQEVRDDLVRQIKEQLGDLPKREAINKLLGLMHHGFDYATDQEYHGYEKPYFVEENLYYPINDCEDRAILFTYLAWNALGVENQLIAYPGHEAAAVSSTALEDLDEEYSSHLVARSPRGYSFKGKDFYISDPTYIGGIIGDCMSIFSNTMPQIDRHYHND